MEPLDILALAVADTTRKLDIGSTTVRIDNQRRVVVVDGVPGLGAGRLLEAALRQVRLQVETKPVPGEAYYSVVVHPS